MFLKFEMVSEIVYGHAILNTYTSHEVIRKKMYLELKWREPFKPHQHPQ